MKPTFFVGSLPFDSVKEAIQFVKDNSLHLPFLPQLPGMNPQEDMIGQVLRGFELGFWDEKASVALEAFQNEFSECPKFKIQLAGPYTVSRVLSLSEDEVWLKWHKLLVGISQQLRQGHFLGEMWLQIDEPFWSKERTPQKGYFEKLQELQRHLEKTVFGIHSCATERPLLSEEESDQFRFLSFDCEKTPVSTEEQAKWKSWLGKDSRRVFAWGTNGKVAPHHDQIWQSATCGLYR